MAQVLKDKYRDNIINASKKELLEHGFEDASMRRIADNAKMTVGNLYRYFKSKEDIKEYIVSDVSDRIDNILINLLNNDIGVEARVYATKYNIKDFRKLLDSFAYEFVEIYKTNRDELNIILMDEETKLKIINWFSNIIKAIIVENYMVEEYISQVEILARSYSVSIFHGMKNIFRNDELNNKSILKILEIFLRGYALIIDSDISQLVND